MIPHEFEPSIKKINFSSKIKIVIFTGNSIRHKVFANTIKHNFYMYDILWFKIDKNKKKKNQKNIFKKLLKFKFSFRNILLKINNKINSKNFIESSREKIENNFFQKNKNLFEFNSIQANPIDNPNTKEVIEKVRSINPSFILTMGGGIYSNDIIKSATVLAINQHDGWCPEYNGSHTVYWALFNREYNKVGNTIHILSSELDGGDILRRSSIVFSPYDTPYEVFIRSCILGNNLMVEVVQDIINNREIISYNQKFFFQKKFYNSRYFNLDINISILNDFKKKRFFKIQSDLNKI